jgi:hypothetical protein
MRKINMWENAAFFMKQGWHITHNILYTAMEILHNISLLYFAI